MKLLRTRLLPDVLFYSITFTRIQFLDAYDSLVIAGGMGEGHIPMTAVAEMIRVVKPGEYIYNYGES